MLDNISAFHIEPTNICTLKCPKCERTEMINRFPSAWKNQNLNLQHFKNFLDINLKDKIFRLCGNSGDPIYYPRLFDLCRWIKSQNSILEITTNGSYRTKEWWQELKETVTSKDTVTFSIDGLPTNFTEYRKNADWLSISQAIDIMVTSNAKIVWKYIVFKYNQENISQAEKLSYELGFDKFQIDYSDRWQENNDPYKPNNQFISPKSEIKSLWFKGDRERKLKPKCWKGQQHFISANGIFHPCCFVASSNFYYKTFWYKNQNKFKIDNTTLTTILNDAEVKNFYNDLLNDIGPAACNFNCSE